MDKKSSSSSGKLVTDLETGIQMPIRPQMGEYSQNQTDTRMRLISNHFDIEMKKGQMLYLFQMSFSPFFMW